MENGGSNASVDSNDSGIVNISSSQIGDLSNAYSDNVSLNHRGSISVYSPEEQVIRQRGRRSPLKKALNDLHQIQQRPICHKINNKTTKDLFRRLRQSSMQSPDTKQFQIENYSMRDDSIDDSSLINSSTSSTEVSSCRRKSLLRTPVKRRLRFRRTTRRASLFQR